MSGFHPTTVSILTFVLDEQRRDLKLFQHRLERADDGASPAALESFRNQIKELTAVAADLARLLTLVQAANAAEAAGLPAVLALDARTDDAPEPVSDAEAAENAAAVDEAAEEDPYGGPDIHDVMSPSEIAEYDRDSEFAQDAADEARWAAEAEANEHHDGADYDEDFDDDTDEDGDV